MLFGALGRWPYDYYRILRWVTCAAAVCTACEAYIWRRHWAVWVFGLIALVFNPLIPFHLSRSIWQVLDTGGAVVFLVGAAILRAPKPRWGESNKLVGPDEAEAIAKELFGDKDRGTKP